ncbi:MAG: neutral zinc metallopeptidase [Bacteroidetes bacterium]|nr:neutral zinc metallopeptidase [Bacteroidota bacterium]
MRWMGQRESDNVEDRRGMGGGKIVGGGIGVTLIAIVIYLLGGDPSQVLQSSNANVPQQSTYHETAADSVAKSFVRVVLANTEDVWTDQFTKMGETYQRPKLVLFTMSTQSGCGGASASTGPFYCPSDEKVYIDLSFYDELKNRFHAPGEFAMAYVIAHEVGHHVQHLLGISDKVHQLQQQGSQEQANALSIRLELQADFLAGMWAHHAQQMKNILDPNDIDDALAAAKAIGDDRLQQEAQGYAVPESFTHGTSKQRMYWFKKGFDSGNMNDGNTFDSNAL